MAEFAAALALADEIILVPIYAAREQADGSVSSEMVAEKIRSLDGHAEAVTDFATAAARAAAVAGPQDLILVMGAGNVTEVSKILVQVDL